MTIHYINKPIFLSLTERNDFPQVVCRDIVSFIHLVRLNIPAILVGGDIEEFDEKYRNYTCRVVGESAYFPTVFSYIPKEKSVFCVNYEPDEERYPKHTLYTRVGLEDWEILLEMLKTWKHKFKAPADIDEMPLTISSFRKRRAKGVFHIECSLDGAPYLSGDVDHLTVLKLISKFPRLFAPSDKFKNKSETIFNAEDLPFEVY